jgi:hypothetical protein
MKNRLAASREGPSAYSLCYPANHFGKAVIIYRQPF